VIEIETSVLSANDSWHNSFTENAAEKMAAPKFELGGLSNKFDGNNYRLWKYQLLNLLEAHGLLDVADGTTARPTTEMDKILVWRQTNAKAKAVITNSLDYTQLEFVVELETAKQMLDKLDALHDTKTEANKVSFLQEFYALRMSPQETVTQFISRVESHVRQLTDAKKTIGDDERIAVMLSGLPSKFNTVITMFKSRTNDKRTVTQLQRDLIDAEQLMQKTDEGTVALAATAKNTVGKNAKTDGKPKQKKFRCYACGKMGTHYARDCKTRSDNEKTKQDQHRDTNEEAKAYTAVVTQEIKLIMQDDVTNVWTADSGCNTHVTSRRDWLVNFKEETGATLTVGGGRQLPVLGRGRVNISAYANGKWIATKIREVLYVPELGHNLLSVSKCVDNGMRQEAHGNAFKFYDGTKVIGEGRRQDDGLYRMLFRVQSTATANIAMRASLKVVHERLGHVNLKSLRDMIKQGHVEGIELKDTDDFFCQGCAYGKAHKLPFKSTDKAGASAPGEHVSADLCTMDTESTGGNKYFALFKCSATGYRYVYFIRNKCETLEKFIEFVKILSNKYGRRIKTFRSDGGGEFMSKEFTGYLKHHGIEREISPPHTPEHNARAERDMRTIVESARAMLYSRDLSRKLWAHAVDTAVYLLNRTPSKGAGGKTSYELWTGKKPNLSHVRTFGIDAYKLVPDSLRKKLDAKAKKLMLVGYSANAYILFDLATRKTSVSRHVTFDESKDEERERPREYAEFDESMCNMPEIYSNAGNAEDENQEPGCSIDGNDQEDAHKDNVTEDISDVVELPHTRPRKKYVASEEQRGKLRSANRSTDAYQANVARYYEPENFDEAMSSSEADEWKSAIDEELSAHDKHGTWKLEIPEAGTKIVTCKWVFKRKTTPNGEITRYKARLCARGFGTNFGYTYAPVVRYDTVRALLALAAANDYEMAQLDVKNAYLNGVLEREVWMEPPRGLKLKSGKEKCRLIKAIYGLPESAYCWNKRINTELLKLNLRRCSADRCVYYGKIDEVETIIALFVDDVICMASNLIAINIVLKKLSKVFELTIVNPSVFVGLEIVRDREKRSIFIHQAGYIKRVIERFGLIDAKQTHIPSDPYTILNYEMAKYDEKNDTIPYRELIGSLMYAATVTRPDIMYATAELSKYIANYGHAHYNAAKRVIKYLKATINLGIEYKFGENTNKLIGYSDADFAGDVDSRRSMSGNAFILNGGVIAWTAKRQKTVALSTCESEYIAACVATREAIWLRRLLKDVGKQQIGGTLIKMDNQAAISLIKKDENKNRTKYVDVQYHFTREKYKTNDIDIEFVATKDQLADMFTKPLSRERFTSLRSAIGMRGEFN